MGSVASIIKSEREKRNVSLAQIAAETRISLRHLKSLEEGRYNDLPGGMYNRAFLRAYCENLNLDPNEILRQYDEETISHIEKLQKPKALPPPKVSPIKLNPIFIWSIMLIVSATGLFFSRKWITDVFSPYFSRPQTTNIRPKSTNLPAAEPVLQPSRQDTASQTEEATPNQVAVISSSGELPSNLPASMSSLSLEITATEECWISIDHDGKSAVRKLLEPGEVQSINAAERFVIRLGNAGGVTLKINGKPAKPLGKAGEVIDLLINKSNLPDYIDQTAG